MNSRSIAALLSVIALSACPTAPQPDPIPPTPKIVSFTATPAAIAPGEKTTLTWEVTDASTVTIADVSRGDVSSVDNKLSGSVMVTPGGNSLYVLTALNARGAKATAVVAVSVTGADTSKLLFAAYPATLGPGETSTLVWSAPDAKVLTITPTGGAPLDLRGQLTAGSVEIDPAAAETTYTLSADGSTRAATVKRVPEVTELTASKKLVKSGDMMTLSWKSRFATRARLSSPGRGELFSTMDAAQVAMGSFEDTIPALPNGTVLTYLLDLEGAGGATRQNISVVIGTDPVLTEARAPEYAKTGSAFTISWKSTSADAVQVRAGGTVVYQTVSPASTAQGSVAIPTPAMETVYTVAAVSFVSGIESTKNVTVKPVGAIATPSFSVTPSVIDDGGTAATLSWNVPNARLLSIVQDGIFTVVARKGTAAETGTTTVYPNQLDGGFVLTATNTVDSPVTASLSTSVAAPAEMSSADGGIFFEVDPRVEVTSPIGTEIIGVAHDDVATTMLSSTFVDIGMTGTPLTFASPDNATATFTPPSFETFLYGTRFATTVSASIDGNVRLGSSAYTGTPPTTFPSTSNTNVLAPFWADLELGPNGRVLWEIQGTAPFQELIVQWDQVRIKPATNSSLTFQVRISQLGSITFEWKTLDNLPAMFTVVTGVAGTSARGLVGTSAVGSKQVFFGPKTTPASLPTALVPFSGFVKLGSSVARLTMPSTKLVRANDLSISEVNFAPPMTLAGGEWFEVSNTSQVPVDLQGWTIDFGGMSTHTIASPTVVPSNGRLLLGQSTNSADNDGVNVAYGYGSTFTMPDTTGSIVLSRGNTNLSASWSATVGGPGISAVVDAVPLLDATATTRVSCSAPASQVYGTQMPQQRGTPGVDSSCFPRVTTIPVSFFDISTSGTRTNPSSPDDALVTIDISSAPLTFEGQTITTLSASTNGFLVTGTTTSSALSNKTRPTTSAPLGTLAPFWDDLRLLNRAGDGLFYQRINTGVDPANPAPHWIVQWSRIEHYNGNDDLTFQVKLFDSGIIEYHYATMTSGSSSNYGTGASATVWLENRAGTLARAFQACTSATTCTVGSPSITSNMALRFAMVP